MLIVALVLAVIGLAALVAAVVTSNELIAWVCIGASALGILLLIIDAIRERTSRRVLAPEAAQAAATTEVFEPVERTEIIEPVFEPVFEPVEASETAGIAYAAEEFDQPVSIAVEDYPDEVVYDEPDYDTLSDDEPEYLEPAEVTAVHTVSDYELAEIEAAEAEAVDEAEEAWQAGEEAEPEPVAEYAEQPQAEHSEVVTYTYVQSDESATTYTYVESPDAATTYTYVEADDTGYRLVEEPREPAETEETGAPMGSEHGN